MKRLFQALIIALFFGVFAAPSFASVQIASVNSIAAIDDEPDKKESSESETKSTENEEAEKKSECTKSSEKKSCDEKEKSSCEKK